MSPALHRDATLRRLREAAWIVLAAVALALWHGDARAACDSDFADTMFFMAPLPQPEQPAPCCAAVTVFPTASAQKVPGGAGGLPEASGLRDTWTGWLAAGHSLEPATGDRPWRPYCARSSRLLR